MVQTKKKNISKIWLVFERKWKKFEFWNISLFLFALWNVSIYRLGSNHLKKIEFWIFNFWNDFLSGNFQEKKFEIS